MSDFNDPEASSSSDDSYVSWVKWFTTLKGNDFFCEVDESFIQDVFNMTGLANQVSYFNWALDLILDVECDMNIDEAEMDKVEADAEVLYGLLHARFILTTRGLQLMNEKFKNAQLGRCPRVMCHGQPTVPIGLSDVHNLECVHIYCPRCEEVYSSRSNKHAHVDGAFFGTTFPHLFFLTYPEHKPQKSTDVFVPRVFGFRINKSAYDVSLEYKNNVSKQEKTHK